MLASNSSSEEFLTLEAVNNDETLAHSEKLVGRQQTPSIHVSCYPSVETLASLLNFQTLK